MKKTYSLVLLSCALLLPTIGCKTTSLVSTNPDGTTTTNKQTTFLGSVITPAGVYSQFRGGNAQAAMIALRADPAALPYLTAVRQTLEATISSGTYDPQSLSLAISAIPVKQIHNPQALEAITAGFALWQMFEPIIQQQINGHNPFIIPALQGISDGIGDALAVVQQQQPSPVPQPAIAPARAPVVTPPANVTPAAPTNAPAAPETSMVHPLHIPPDLARSLTQFRDTGSFDRSHSSLALARN